MKLKIIEKENLREWAKKFFSDDGKDYQAFDIDSEIDSSLTYEENQSILRDKIQTFINIYNEENIKKMKKKEAEIISKEEYIQIIDEELRKVEIEAEKEFQKTLNIIAQKTTTEFIEDFYYVPKCFVGIVADRKAKGFILYGEAGVGKSFCVKRAFKERNKKFVYLTGHITSLRLYEFLYKNRKENIVFDDVNILESEQNLNLLKSCLDDDNGIVTYETTSPKLRTPNKFLFEGTITLLLNDRAKGNKSLCAVESRVLTYDLKMNYKDKVKIMFELIKQDYKDLTKEERLDIMKWVNDNTNEATENFNLRVLFQVYEMFRYDKENWKRLAGKVLVKDEELELIIQGIGEWEWIEQTGKSRRTYYRYKEKVKC